MKLTEATMSYIGKEQVWLAHYNDGSIHTYLNAPLPALEFLRMLNAGTVYQIGNPDFQGKSELSSYNWLRTELKDSYKVFPTEVRILSFSRNFMFGLNGLIMINWERIPKGEDPFGLEDYR